MDHIHCCDIVDWSETVGCMYFGPGPVLRFRGPGAKVQNGALNLNIKVLQ
jgi:hypothetical protein